MSKPGESFEAQIALILHSADFVIKEQPHRVVHRGRQVGDLDVLAQVPSSGEIIGVSCKDWHGQTPGSEQFSHLVEMLEFENIRYGIFASSGSIAHTLPLMADHVRSTKGISIILLGHDDIARLRNLAYANQAADIEDYFKTRLGLGSDKRTVADEIRAQKSVIAGRTVECERLLPINFWNAPPRYIENSCELLPTHSTLKLEPYLVIDYSLHVQVRHPVTGKLLRESKDDGLVVVDASRDATLPEYDPVFRHLAKYYMNAEIRSSVQENGFAIIKTESVVNQREILRVIREKIAAQSEIRASYTTAKNEQRQKIVRPRPEDVHVIGPYLIHVPIWDARFSIGSRTYRRIYFGYDDSDTILDEMSRCQTQSCVHGANAVCTVCYCTVCHSHARPCLVCSRILCASCTHGCIDCRKNFCGKHRPSTVCVVCRSTLCHDCSPVQCAECKGVACSGHRERCAQCGGYACSPHVISKKFLLVAKNFCSQLCLNVFDENYRSCGTFARFRKIVKK